MAKNKVRVELDLKGINRMMKGNGVYGFLQQAGEHVADRATEYCGEAFRARTARIRWIAVTNVFADTPEAKKAVYDENVLEKAIGSYHLPRRKGGR